MEKIKDYFINFVLFLVYFIIVLFALVFNNSLGWFLLAFFTLYVSWSLISLSSFLKKLSVTCTLQPLVYRKKSMQVIFSIAKRELFLYLSLVYKSASQQSLQKKTRDFDSYK